MLIYIEGTLRNDDGHWSEREADGKIEAITESLTRAREDEFLYTDN